MNTQATRLIRAVNEELYGLQLPLVITKLLAALLPKYTGNRLRTYILRLAGFQVGPGCTILGMPTLIGGPGLEKRLTIGCDCLINVNCFFDLCGPISIGSRVSFGPEVMLITASHDMSCSDRRAGQVEPKPITIHDGCWLGARALVLPGITIGAGSIVAAGAVVTHDVKPNTVVGGIPAKLLRELEP
jgi:maltose O-acetyltransferase